MSVGDSAKVSVFVDVSPEDAFEVFIRRVMVSKERPSCA